MDKVYIIKTRGGSFDDRWELNHKAFYKGLDAADYMEKYNAELNRKKLLVNKCDSCYSLSCDCDNIEEYIKKVSEFCDCFNIVVDEYGEWECKNEVPYDISEEHDASIEELEIE